MEMVVCTCYLICRPIAILLRLRSQNIGTDHGSRWPLWNAGPRYETDAAKLRLFSVLF
jgi:hypothetical protein